MHRFTRPGSLTADPVEPFVNLALEPPPWIGPSGVVVGRKQLLKS